MAGRILKRLTFTGLIDEAFDLYKSNLFLKEGFDIKWLARNVAASSPKPKAVEKAEPA